MEQAYFKSSIPVSNKPPTIVPLPERDSNSEPLRFKSSLFTNRLSDSPLVLTVSENLIHESCATVFLGHGYDGLPLLLNVSRSHSVKAKVLSSLGVTDEKDIHDSIRKPLEELELAVQSRSCAAGIVLNETKDSSENNERKISYYKTYSDVGTLIQQTIYSKITGDNSSSSLNERGEGYAEELKLKSTTMHIGVPLTKEPIQPLSVKTNMEGVKLEPLFLENLAKAIPSVKFECFVEGDSSSSNTRSYKSSTTTNNKIYQGLLSDRDSYLHALSLSSRTQLLISRQELATHVILYLARDAFEKMHSKGRVHGDIKPANILFLDDGPKLIDARGCSSGSICATFTPKWCAPEQTLGKPVTPAADVYAFGMLLLHLLNGEIYGEVKNFKMPSTSSVIQVLDTEGVWIESSIGLDEGSRSAWRNSLAKFLAFDPNKRPSNGKEFAEELEKLLKEYPLISCKDLKVESSLGRAQLQRISLESKSLDTGRYLKDNSTIKTECYAAWILNDSYPSVV